MKRGVGLGVFVAAAAIAWDPSARAAEPKRAAALLVAIGAIALSISRSRPDIRTSPRASRADAAWLGVLALSSVSALWGISSGLLDLATWAAAGACAFASARAGRAAALRTARVASLVAGGVASAWALIAFAAGARGFSIHAGQGNPNWLGLLIAVCLPVSLDVAARARRSPSRGVRVACIALAAVQPAALWLSHSRVAWIAAGVSAAILLFGVRRRRRALVTMATTLAIGAALVGVTVGVAHRAARPAAATAHVAAPVDRAHVEDVPATRSLRGRAWIAARAASAAWRAGPFGAGLGRFGHAYLAAQGDALATMPPRPAARAFVNAGTAHDELLQLAVESGPLAAILAIVALGLGARDHRRARWHAGAAAVVALAICALADSPLRQPAVCLVFALQAAAAPRSRRVRSVRSHALVRVALLGACAWLLLVSTRAWLSTRALEAAKTAMPDARVAAFVKAARIDPTSGDAWLALGLAELAAGRPDEAADHLARADALVATVATRTALGEANLARGYVPAARDAYARAVAIDPGSLRAQVGLAESLRRLGDLDESDRHAHVARAVAPGDPRVAALLDRIAEERMSSQAFTDHGE